jgi:hypothetical protein
MIAVTKVLPSGVLVHGIVPGAQADPYFVPVAGMDDRHLKRVRKGENER